MGLFSLFPFSPALRITTLIETKFVILTVRLRNIKEIVRENE